MKISVGSNNPVKRQAALEAFEKVFPEEVWEIEGVEVDSEVGKQPMSDEEGIRGARKRAQKALEKLGGDYGVGLEGCLQQIGEDWFESGWCVVINKEGLEGIGSSFRVIAPKKMMGMIKEGKELGEVDDILFKKTNSKQEWGHFGLMTNGKVTRTQGYREGVISSLSRFLHPELFV